jgi:threonine dehydrogenase-like Zn-dependent dehydrogenase
VFPAEKTVRVIDHPEPRATQASDVLVRILDVGVCGTDREIARGDYGTPPAGSPYLVLGHESLAEVIERGPAVEDLQPGDLVVTMVRRPCGLAECPACAVGRPDFCVTGRFTERGINGRHGFMTERVVDERRYMIPVPRALRDVGVLVEPLTIAEKALLEVGDVEDRLPWLKPGHPVPNLPRQRAVVLGAGPVGLLGTMALLVRRFETWVYSQEANDSAKAAWVRSVGATYLCSKEITVGDLPGAVGNIDLIYEATGASQLAFQAMKALGVNGVFVFTGVPGRRGPVELDTDLLMRNLVLKNQLVYGTVNAGGDAFEAAVTDLTEFQRRWPGPLAALIPARHPPDDCQDLLLGPRTGIKPVMTFAGAR